jgi:hypothetical protein
MLNSAQVVEHQSSIDAIAIDQLRSGKISILNVMDLSGFLHILRHHIESTIDVRMHPEKATQYAHYAFHWAQACGMSYTLSREATRCYTLWVTDNKMEVEGLVDQEGKPCKGYWRHKYFAAYKPGRPAHYLTPILRNYFDTLSFPSVGWDGIEADDVAGGIARLWQGAEKRGKPLPATNLLFWSGDHDWHQLCQSPSTLCVEWSNRTDKATGVHIPTVLNEEGVREAMIRHMAKAPKWAQARYQVPPLDEFTAQEVVKMKCLIGDSSDGLKVRSPRYKNGPETIPENLIDLQKQPDDWKIWGDFQKMQEIKRAIQRAKNYTPEMAVEKTTAKLMALHPKQKLPSSSKLIPLQLLK